MAKRYQYATVAEVKKIIEAVKKYKASHLGTIGELAQKIGIPKGNQSQLTVMLSLKKDKASGIEVSRMTVERRDALCRVLIDAKVMSEKDAPKSTLASKKKTKSDFSEVIGYLEPTIPINGYGQVIKIDSLSTLKTIADKIEDTQESKYDDVTVEANGHNLMRDNIKYIPDELKAADEVDINGLRRFLSERQEIPLVVVKNGTFIYTTFLTQMYEMFGALGTSMTPYEVNAMSDAALLRTKFILCTSGGKNPDITYLSDRLINVCPNNVAVITSTTAEDGNKVVEDIQEVAPENCFIVKTATHDDDGFLDTNSSFFYMTYIYRAFMGGKVAEEIRFDAEDLAKNYSYGFNDKSVYGYNLPNLRRIKNVMVLYGNYGKAVAQDIESKFIEGGVACVTLSDYRDFCHGKFIYLSNNVEVQGKDFTKSETLLVLLVSPEERHIVEYLRQNAIAPQFPTVVIKTKHDSPLATIELAAKAISFACEFGEAKGFNLNSPKNYANIDKRFPKNNTSYIKDFNQYGCHRAEWNSTIKPEANNFKPKTLYSDLLERVRELTSNTNTDERKTVITELDSILKKIFSDEKERTALYSEQWEEEPALSFEDVDFNQPSVYHTDKRQVWSFNKNTDIRNRISLDIGNMSSTYGLDFMGKHFANSEALYQCAIFLDTPKAIEIQGLVAAHTNGLQLKRQYIRNVAYADCRRTDFECHGARWCYKWMMLCVLLKIQQNAEFKGILRKIPKGTVIVEKAQRKNDTMWGAWNPELEDAWKTIIAAESFILGVKPTNTKVRKFVTDVNNLGTWKGLNYMGKCLTMFKIALDNNLWIPIDIDVLNEVGINWFGNKMHFSQQEDIITIDIIDNEEKIVSTDTVSVDLNKGDVIGAVKC